MHFTQHLLVLALSAALAATAAPVPSPAAVPLAASRVVRAGRAGATPAPLVPPTRDVSPDALYNFYLPAQEAARQAEAYGLGNNKQALLSAPQHADAEIDELTALLHLQRRAPTPSENVDQAPVPLSQLPPPTFPAEIASCGKCQADYPSLSSCMHASSVFENFTSIFNSPLAYISVIKCACTDTFQSVYPQCVDCFQNTNQCWWLGTDPQGTGAPSIISNMRSLCGLGSALLGGVNDANNISKTSTSNTFKAITTGAEYRDQTTGSIFGNGAAIVSAGLPMGVALTFGAALGLALL